METVEEQAENGNAVSSAEETLTSPDKPEKPLDSDCCGGGCTPCVLDIYQQELAIWERECAGIKSGINENVASTSDENEVGSIYVAPTLSPSAYGQYQISSITQETHNSRRITCRLGPNQCLGLQPGQHVIIRGHVDGKAITRQYTPINYNLHKGSFQLLIKIYKDGRMSQAVQQWKVGDWLDVRGPFGSLQYHPNQYKLVLMLAAGTGIAPMAQLIQAMLAQEEEEGKMRLLYSCRNSEEILMKHEISEWRQFWNFSAAFLLSQESSKEGPNRKNGYAYGEEIIQGRLNLNIVANELGSDFSGTRVLICGTRSFDSDVQQILHELNFPNNQILKF